MATKPAFEAPGLAAVISTTSLTFTAGDAHCEHYVIGRLALAEWSRQHGRALVRLPAVRGKRQTANAKLITAISET
jgi:hypothetical protein